RQQSDQHANAGNAAALEHGLRPAARLRSDQARLLEQLARAALNCRHLVWMDELRLGREVAGLDACVHDEWTKPPVEDAHDARIPAHPDLSPHVLPGHRVVRLRDLDVPVTMDDADRFLEVREALRGKRAQRSSLVLL